MPRPRLRRKTKCCPKTHCFKPQGIPARDLDTVNLTKEETESLRLKHVKGLDQTEAAKEMNTSQSTFQRILASAQKKVSEALIKGKSIRMD